MPAVFRFTSKDSRQRATMRRPTPGEAAAHVTDVLNGGPRDRDDLWTLDDDGGDLPTAADIAEALRRRETVRLFDQGSSDPKDSLEIVWVN